MRKRSPNIKRAVEISDTTFAHILTYICPGVTEKDINDELEFYMRKVGAKSSASTPTLL
jgi:Xaa-Pro aminopeptidase